MRIATSAYGLLAMTGVKWHIICHTDRAKRVECISVTVAASSPLQLHPCICHCEAPSGAVAIRPPLRLPFGQPPLPIGARLPHTTKSLS